MVSHAIFQYNVLAIDDTHNTWTNVIVKMTILRLLGSSDDKEKRGVARPEGPPLRTRIEAFCYHRLNRCRAKWTHRCNHREGLRARVLHRMNRRYPCQRHRFFRWYADLQLTIGATATRLGGLYIRLTSAIWRLLELLNIPHTPKNISKPYKSIKIISLALSTLWECCVKVSS